MYKTVADVDWANWEPVERATLMFVVQDGRVLLIHKKRGLGKGKINGPGGRLEADETPRECAIRETQEELCITPTGVAEAGELFFQFTDGFSIHGYVFTATGYDGIPTETDEAIPIWSTLEAIPYEKMWADDRTWIPHMLAGRAFSGKYIFEGDYMLDDQLELL